MKALLILFLYWILLILAWKAMEPEKPVKEIISEVISLVFSLFKAAFIKKSTTTSSTSSDVSTMRQDLSVYYSYRLNYESVAYIVWTYIQIIQRKYHLRCPTYVSGIYCAEVADRIKQENGITFSYEVPCEEPMFDGGMKKATPSVDTEKIAEMLRRNLPAYMTGGYYFTGDIFVWLVEDFVRIEIQGVGRNII